MRGSPTAAARADCGDSAAVIGGAAGASLVRSAGSVDKGSYSPEQIVKDLSQKHPYQTGFAVSPGAARFIINWSCRVPMWLPLRYCQNTRLHCRPEFLHRESAPPPAD